MTVSPCRWPSSPSPPRKPPGSGRGCRPAPGVAWAASQRSRSTNTAPGRCPASYAARPDRPSRYQRTSARTTDARWACSQAGSTTGGITPSTLREALRHPRPTLGSTMSSLSERLTRGPASRPEQVDHARRLVADWQLLADLAFADLTLWVPLPSGAWWCVAQVRPLTAPTSRPEDLVGAEVTG